VADCPICYGPDGNCTGHLGPPAHISPIYEPPITGGFTVPEHVYEDIQISAKRWTTVLKYYAGQQITLEAARQAGLLVDDEQESTP
jgi:hypothetical protein